MLNQTLPSTVWPIGLLLACLVLEAGVLRFGIDDLDEGYFVQQAARVLHGQVPYRDFQSLYTPGLAYLHAGLFALLGGPSILAARTLALIARGGVVLLLFVLTRPFVRHPVWAAVPGLVLLLVLDDAPVRWEPHPGWLSTLFALLAVWCVTRRWLIAAGAAAALSYAFKQNTGVFILAAIVVWTAWWCRRRSIIPLVAFIAVTSVWLVPLLLAIDFQVRDLGVLIGAVNQGSLVSPPEPTLLIPLAALLGGLWLRRRDSHPHLRWYLLAGVALFATEFPRMDTLHLMWSALLLLVVGAIALSRASLPAVALALAVTLVLLAPTWTSRLTFMAESFSNSNSNSNSNVGEVQATMQTATDLNGLVADIQQRTRPGEPIFVYPTSPLVYVLADRPNPTQFDHLNPGAATPEQLQQVIDDLQRSNTRVIVISDFWESVWGAPGDNAILEDWLNAHYPTQVARDGAYQVRVQSGL